MARNWKASGVVPCSEHRVLPVASEVLPMGNSTLTSIAGERTTAAYTVYACASSHRETTKKKACQIWWVFLNVPGIINMCLCARVCARPCIDCELKGGKSHQHCSTVYWGDAPMRVKLLQTKLYRQNKKIFRRAVQTWSFGNIFPF